MPLFKKKANSASSSGRPAGPGHTLVSWPRQRAIMVYIPLGLFTIFSTAVLWNHYDGVIQNSTYNAGAKVGLFVVDFIAFGIATWSLFARHFVLALYCFLAKLAIAIMMTLHAGAVLELDAGKIEQAQRIEAVGNAVARIAEADAAARIKAASQEAQRLNSIGQTRTAARLTRSAASAADTGKATELIIQESTKSRPMSKIFSPEYMETGIYFVPVLFALVLGMIAVGIAKVAEPTETQHHQTGGGGEGNYLPAQPLAPSTVVAGFNPGRQPGQNPHNVTFNQTGGAPPKAQSQ